MRVAIQLNVIAGGSKRTTASPDEVRIGGNNEIVSEECHSTNRSRRIR